MAKVEPFPPAFRLAEPRLAGQASVDRWPLGSGGRGLGELAPPSPGESALRSLADPVRWLARRGNAREATYRVPTLTSPTVALLASSGPNHFWRVVRNKDIVFSVAGYEPRIFPKCEVGSPACWDTKWRVNNVSYFDTSAKRDDLLGRQQRLG
jgi:hypothetical protein